MPTIDKWKGLRNTTAARSFKNGEMDIARNVDIDNAERLRTRQGFTQVAENAAHSIWSDGDICLFVQSSVLKRLMSDETVVTLQSLQTNNRMSYDSVNGVVFCTNGVDSLKIQGGRAYNWGVRMPKGQPVATASAGNLPPGRYLYAMTYVRADGFESGTPLAGQIDLTTTGGIEFSSIESSTYDAGCGIILYLSSPNGEVLYRAAILADGVTSYAYREDATDLTVPLLNSLAFAAPTGSLVRIYKGIAYVASGNVVYYSDPYQFELFRMRTNFLQFDGPVTMMAAVEDGMFIGTDDNTYFVAGDRPDQMKQQAVFPYGVVPGTAVTLPVSLVAKDETAEETGSPSGPAVMWFSARGVCVGFSGGAVRNLTETNYSMPDGQQGAAVIRQVRGYTQYLASVQGTGVAANSYS